MAYQYALSDGEFARSEFSFLLGDAMTAAAIDAILEDGRLKLSLFAITSSYDQGEWIGDIAAHLEVSTDRATARVVFDEDIPDATVDLFNSLAVSNLVDPVGTYVDAHGQEYTVPLRIGVTYRPGSSWVGDYELSTAPAFRDYYDMWGPAFKEIPSGRPGVVVRTSYSFSPWALAILLDSITIPYGMRPSPVEFSTKDLLVRQEAALQ